MDRRRRCAALSALAYRDDGAICPGRAVAGLRSCVPVKNGDAFALYAEDDRDHAYLAIRGSDSPHDWLDNVSSQRKQITPRMKVHRGFLRHAVLIADELRQMRLHQREAYRDRLVLCGHSLGGAASILLPLVEPSCWPREIITFGAPRCLAYESAGSYRFADRVRRYVGLSDIVPLLPLPICYAHVGQVFYVNGGVFSERRWGAIGKYLRLWQMLACRGLGLSLPAAVVEQHKMDRYQAALATND